MIFGTLARGDPGRAALVHLLPGTAPLNSMTFFFNFRHQNFEIKKKQGTPKDPLRIF